MLMGRKRCSGRVDGFVHLLHYYHHHHHDAIHLRPKEEIGCANLGSRLESIGDNILGVDGISSVWLSLGGPRRGIEKNGWFGG